MDAIFTKTDITLLQLLIEIGPHTFPLITDEADDRATLHIESLVVQGLVERSSALANTGTTYIITLKGRTMFDRFLKIG